MKTEELTAALAEDCRNRQDAAAAELRALCERLRVVIEPVVIITGSQLHSELRIRALTS